MAGQRIEQLDLRDPRIIRRQAREELVTERGWWTDWDAFDWFGYRRHITVNFMADTRAFHEAISRATMAMFAMTPGFKRMVAAATDAQTEALKLRAVLATKPRRPWWAPWR